MFGVRHTGVENIPAEGGLLIVANHQSHLDPPLIGMGCPRQINYVARRSLFKVPLLGHLIRSLRAIPIDRDGFAIDGIKEALRRLKRGEAVLIFPEGTRCRGGRMGHFKPGFTALAQRSGAAILPVAIHGAYDAWPRSQPLPGPGTIHVHFGPPMLPGEIAQCEDRELVAEVEIRVRQCLSVIQQRKPFAQRL
jgi:1-acyl-sn-glycerol-3-phosphate acyltransferase